MIEQKLEEVRRNLLDLTRRNRLLNHRSTGQRTLPIIETTPSEVYRVLVEEQRVMHFLPREQSQPEAPSNPIEEVGAATDSLPPTASEPHADTVPAAEPTAPETPVPRHNERDLPTDLSQEKLQTRLIHLARQASSAIQEQGYNILFVTLGTVQWRETTGDGPASVAPLVFIPVELKRKSVNARHEVRLFDDDVLTNPCLVELCQAEFQLALPTFDPEHDHIDQYLTKVREAISALPGWSVGDDVHVGLFSFSKLLMYRDLDPQSWPETSPLTQHELIRQFTGDEAEMATNDGGEGIPDPSTLDQIAKPDACYQVVDADSSQQAAILAAKRGLSMVIDGPPGTGKSQTITNIIAECLSEGKTVLFVSEKAAALEVVKGRLEQAGLGDAVLELHSRKTSKNAFLQELQRVLEKDAAAARVNGQTAAELERTKEAVNRYHREVHEPFGRLGLSPFRGMARAIGLSAAPEASCDIPSVADWSADQLADAEQRLLILDRRLGRVGNPAEHPWRGVGLDAAGLRERQQIVEACSRLNRGINEVLRAGPTLASQLGRPAPSCLRDLSAQLSAADTITNALPMPPQVVEDTRWDTVDPELTAWIGLGRRRAELLAKWQPTMKPEAETEEWETVLRRRRAQSSSVTRFFNPSWYADGKRLRAMTRTGTLPPINEQLALLEALIESGRLRKQIEQEASRYAERFGVLWRGADSDWSALEKYATDAVAIRRFVRQKQVDPTAAATLLDPAARGPLSTAANAMRAAMSEANEAWLAWTKAINSDDKQWLGTDWETADLASVSSRLADLPAHLESLQDWIDLRQSIRECGDGPLSAFLTWILSPAGLVAHGRISPTFLRQFFRLWVEEAFSQRQSLRQFRGQDHEAVIERFRELDRQWIDITRRRLVAQLAAHRPRMNQHAHAQSKLGLLQAEFRKKTRHMPLRKLLAAAGEVVQAIKPCLMMSPLSVAQYLAPGGIKFDLVIFDEASQVEPADGYGAIARGKQLILVGDERQLPPTDFFSRADHDQPQEDSDDSLRAGDLESILSLGKVRFRHQCGLRWHYRSRHSSLIEFSNNKFYDGQLRVFPSPHTDCRELGLAFRHVEGSVYLRGAGRYNPIEAKTVAAEVIRHATEHPQWSLGVGTLNFPQQKAIEDEIETLRREHDDERVEAAFTDWAARGQPFFVKNLENIQGDERDVIFLSIAYGKDASGRMYASFGALNGEHGWKRLNVLITRARQRCVVFSAIHAEDINLGTSPARGVVALKEYLYAAEHGHMTNAAVPGGDHDSEFEAAVCKQLRDRGWEVHPQVGCAGFWIDLAVVDPRSPGRYLLGVECDGATYHSSPTARDRDRLRQAVLEGLGWKIHRVWSTDWFQRPGKVLDELLRHLEELRSALPSTGNPGEGQGGGSLDRRGPDETPTERSPGESEKGTKDSQAQLSEGPAGTVPYRHGRSDAPIDSPDSFFTLAPKRLAKIITDIVTSEGPIHSDEAFRCCVAQFDLRASSRPREQFDRGLDKAITAGSITRNGDFLWPAGQTTVPVRYRGEDCPVTKPELIPPEEFDAAVRLVLEQQFGVRFDALIESTARLFGFARTGPKLKAAIEASLVRLDGRGEISIDGSQYITLAGDHARK